MESGLNKQIEGISVANNIRGWGAGVEVEGESLEGPTVLETGGEGFTREVEIDHEESISGQAVVSAWCWDVQSHGGYRSVGVSSGEYLDNLYINTHNIHISDIFLGMVPKMMYLF